MKLKRIISLLLCLILTFSALSLFTQNASAATRTGADKLTSYTTSSSKTYVLNAIDYYLSNNSTLSSTGGVFLFEGASKDPAAYADGGKRNQAIAVVVDKNGAIIYVVGSCSTIPDCPDKKYPQNDSPSAPTIRDGTYRIKCQKMHIDQPNEQDAFRVTNWSSGSDGLACLRFYSDPKTFTTSVDATAIFVHRRSNEYANDRSVNSGTSEGCLLVGVGDTSFETFYSKLKGVFAGGYGYLVVDRHLAVNKLKGYVYGNYSNAVETLTSNSANASSGGSGSGSSGGTDVTTSLPLLKQGGSQNTKLRVKTLQRMLIAKGYSCGSCGADGDFGSGTKSGVIKFQKAKGLTQDGIVGNATWTALLKACQIQKGAKGDLVKLLQQILISQGYSCGSCGADGDFGTATRNAVIQFQKAKGLSQDGIVGKDTWTRLLLAYFY